MDDLDPVAAGAEGPVLPHLLLEHRDEVPVDLHGVEPVLGEHPAGDLPGNRARARPHLEDAAGGAVPAELADQGPGQEAAAGQDRPGDSEVTPTLAEEVSALP